MTAHSDRRGGALPLCFLLIVAATLLASLAQPSAMASIRPKVTPAEGALFGMYAQSPVWDVPTRIALIEGLEADLGRKLDVDHHFYAWGRTFPTWVESWDLQGGRIPMITWGHHSTSEINSGSQDAYIKAMADGVKALNGPIFLRWFGEMDASAWTTELGSPADFISAWRRVHQIFDGEGATNVLWVWCPNASAFGSGEAQSLYPGDAYVDWIGADAYNWSPLVPGGAPGGKWTDFASKFATFYAWGSQAGKPLMVAETGAQEDPNNSTHKAQWITDMGNALQYQYPAIKALVYFSSISSSNQGGTFDWRVISSTPTYTAWLAVGHLPYFGGSDILPPTAPTGLTAAAPSPDRVDLNWNASVDNQGVTAYVILRDGSSVGSVSSPGFSDTTTSGGTTYQYKVVAKDAAGNASDPSNVVSVTTPAASDSQPPTVPTGVAATAPSASEVHVTWVASTDNRGVTAYDVYRNGSLLPSTDGSTTSIVDSSVSPGASYSYRVAAWDAAGNRSALSSAASVTTPSALFSDGFESGNLSSWSTVTGLTVQSSLVQNGAYAARGTSSGPTLAYAIRNLSQERSDLYVKLSFDLVSHGPTSTYLLRLRSSSGIPLLGLHVRGDNKLSIYNHAQDQAIIGTKVVPNGAWHTVELHALIAGSSSKVEVWLDGVKQGDLSTTLSAGTTPIGQLQLGDNIVGRSYTIAFDDVSVDTVFLPVLAVR